MRETVYSTRSSAVIVQRQKPIGDRRQRLRGPGFVNLQHASAQVMRMTWQWRRCKTSVASIAFLRSHSPGLISVKYGLGATLVSRRGSFAI